MNHKEILVALPAGLCLIFVGSLVGAISSYHINNAQLQYSHGDIQRGDLYDAREFGNTLEFVEHLLQICGALILSTFSAVGAFIIEDKYAKLGLLLFSALVTVFILTTLVFKLAYVPTYY